jgi:hypothetical protein
MSTEESQEPKELKININSSQIRKDLSEEIEAKEALKSRVKELEKEAEENKHKVAFFEANSGKGTLPASLNREEMSNFRNSREYEGNSMQEAYRNMIDDLVAKNDTETLNKLLAQGINAGTFKTNFEVKDDWKDGTSCIRKALNNQNKRVRRE